MDACAIETVTKARGESRPRALLLAPTRPSRGGNGLAMRAGLLLDALACHYRVDLWCIPIAAGQAAHEVAPVIDRQVVAPLELDPGWQLARRSGPDALRRLGRPTACRFAVSRALADLRARLGPPDYDCTLVLRSYLLPFATPLDRAGGELGRRVLDLDDDEAMTHERLAALAIKQDTASGADLSAAHRLEAELYETYEKHAVPWADRLLAAQPAHCNRLRRRFPNLDVDILPNAVEVQEHLPRKPRSASSRPRLLFVGNLGYAPNVEAVRELALEVLPSLEKRGLEPQLRLVGCHPSPPVTALDHRPAVDLFPNAPTLDEHYGWADQIVLPLRAGGGTRIKILEAFAAGVPVVSTSLGAEGLDVKDGQELMLADAVEDLAHGVELLARRPEQAKVLAQRAHSWVRQNHERQQTVLKLAASLVHDPESCPRFAELSSTSVENSA